MKRSIAYLLLFLATVPGNALGAKLKLVDIEFKMLQDNSFLTTMDITWEVQSTTMGGFYLQVPHGADDPTSEDSYAVLNKRTKVSTEITKVDNQRYDIDLANGARFQGAATYHVQYHYVPETNENDETILLIVAWDQSTDQRITVVTDERIDEDASIEAVAENYYIKTDCVGRIVPTKIYLAEGVCLGFRIEENNVPDLTPRIITIKRIARNQNTETVAARMP